MGERKGTQVVDLLEVLRQSLVDAHAFPMCSACGGELPRDVKPGATCPHCQVSLVAPSGPAAALPYCQNCGELMTAEGQRRHCPGCHLEFVLGPCEDGSHASPHE